ncbi:MAG: undecaprenyldiphospho-muramoylpentapeptide beta-N-acetylglucosaminyltransferase [Pseudomonadales bacterium]|jgi:UDP-N-acetylglucosamine--N-acetylmuramyl-(pentapeptide) pyrophosphoryl-undecaprenol N-acetylglucosamine transferase|nr:undecaprenyldiphospho-muramoylpentapeptide beta-N-acetylglucosaminyltransferase [Pseudomonadales bacterium]
MNAAAPKILIMAGGTGGHIFPALTIAQALMARGAQVEWLGTRQGLEAKVIGNTAIPLHCIRIGGLRGKALWRKLLAPFAIAVAVCQAWRVIRRSAPGCVLGLGGFVTGPGGVAAWLAGKPLLIHEQNAIAGLTNTLLYPLAQVVMEGFPAAFTRKVQLQPALARCVRKAKTQDVGNPVRQTLSPVTSAGNTAAKASAPLHLLVLGGSLGAAALNAVVPRLLQKVATSGALEVRHQCGEKLLEATHAAYRDAGLAIGGAISVAPFIDDMAAAYRWADLVLCRAGASTVAELCMCGLPAILVPYPHAVDDHQRANAQVMVAAGAALMVPQQELDAEALWQLLAPLCHDRAPLRAMGAAAASLARPQAAARAADLCLEYCA